jgi:hypothetical protein
MAAHRKPTVAAPGRWYVCSGEGPTPLADGPDTYRVISSTSSTISVEVYDSAHPDKKMPLPPGGKVDISVKSTLFLVPDYSHSGTAEGEYAATT